MGTPCIFKVSQKSKQQLVEKGVQQELKEANLLLGPEEEETQCKPGQKN